MAIAKASRMGLILSLFTFIIAFVVTASSTYAWFAMNETVSATNMQITVKSDNTYLVIANSDSVLTDGKFTGSTSATTVASTAAAAQVFPTRVKPASTGSTLTWQTAAGTSYSNGAASNSTYTDISGEANIAKHVAHFRVWVGLNPDASVVNASNLKVNEITLASSIANDSIFYNALSVAVVCGSNLDNYASAGRTATDGVKAGSNTELAATIKADGTAIPVDIYVYINGDDAAVTTANSAAANLGTYTVGISFIVTPGTVA